MDLLSRLSARESRSAWRPFVSRGAAFVVVYVAALAALSAGVGVSERDLTDAGLFTRAYYAFGLFVLGGLDLGTPVGGPAFARTVLWITYFAGPLITASAILETALRLLVPLALRVRPPSDHVVIAGAGRLSLMYLQEFRKRDRRRQVIVVEKDRNHPGFGELRDYERVQMKRGDITSDAVLRGLNLEQAHRVVLTTGDDFVNLDAAAKILRMAPSRAGRIIAHVSDMRFLRKAGSSSVARDCHVFNGHEFAAKRLVNEHLTARFQRTPYRDPVVLAGFGRFGQTVLHQLQQNAPGKFGPVVLVDDRATHNVRMFEEVPGFSDNYERVVVEGDLLDPEIVHGVGARVGEDGDSPVIIVGSGDDSTNLHVALSFCESHPDALVIVRSFRTSPFMEEVLREAGAHPFNLGELIVAGMPEAWF